ncbi:MAG: dethiobiotin synthase [Bacteroidota bacterium]
MKGVFVTGIGTEVGKTVVSAILVELLGADYWKPIQAGDLDFSDSDRVKSWISNTDSIIHPEAYRLRTPASPHHSAELDNIEIELEDFTLPDSNRPLIVEGAGGLQVPLNYTDTMLDLIHYLNLPVVLVSRNYLGSINHTMLSIESLLHRNVQIKGIVFNGDPVPSTENIILKHFKLPVIGRVPQTERIGPDIIQEHTGKFDRELLLPPFQ